MLQAVLCSQIKKKVFFWHRHVYLAVDRQKTWEREGVVTCSKVPPAWIQTRDGCIYGMHSNHSTTCVPCSLQIWTTIRGHRSISCCDTLVGNYRLCPGTLQLYQTCLCRRRRAQMWGFLTSSAESVLSSCKLNLSLPLNQTNTITLNAQVIMHKSRSWSTALGQSNIIDANIHTNNCKYMYHTVHE